MVTAEEARELRVKKGAVNHETYKEIYGKVCNRIKAAAARGSTSTEFKIPPFVPGRPMYTMSHAVRYNADKLRHAGFVVTLADDADKLKIDWSPRTASPSQKKKKPAVQEPKKKLDAEYGTSSGITRKLEDLKKKLPCLS